MAIDFVRLGTASATIGAALVAGIFFAFSTFVMAALRRLPPEQGIAAMQSINVTVLNPWFLSVFFGTAVGSIALAASGIQNWGAPGAVYLIFGCLLYVVGCVLVTAVFNVPLNNSLTVVDATGTDGDEIWRRYLSVWTNWNHVRTIASLAAAALFIAASR